MTNLTNQSKIHNMVSILQDQRNSALDALVSSQSDQLATMEKLKEAQKQLSDVQEQFQGLVSSRNHLELKLAERETKVAELEKSNLDLAAKLAELQAKTVPVLNPSRRKTKAQSESKSQSEFDL